MIYIQQLWWLITKPTLMTTLFDLRVSVCARKIDVSAAVRSSSVCVRAHCSKSKTVATREQLTPSISTVSHYVRLMGAGGWMQQRVLYNQTMCVWYPCAQQTSLNCGGWILWMYTLKRGRASLILMATQIPLCTHVCARLDHRATVRASSLSPLCFSCVTL